jgi:hypothetical protein
VGDRALAVTGRYEHVGGESIWTCMVVLRQSALCPGSRTLSVRQ